MFDSICNGIDHTRYDRLIIGKLNLIPYLPLMLVARICSLEIDERGVCLQHRLNDIAHLHVVMMRASIISPAEMQAHFFCRNTTRRMIERLDRQWNIAL